MSDLDMLKILKGFDTVEKKSVIKESKITECGPMTQESAPNVNISVTGNSMADIMRALANIDSGSPTMAMSMDSMEAEEEAFEDWENEPEEEYQDHEYMTKTLSGGLNREKKMHPPAAAGDNPMAVESIKDRLYRALNEKKAKPDFLDMDKDGNKKEPMKKAVADKKKAPVKESPAISPTFIKHLQMTFGNKAQLSRSEMLKVKDLINKSSIEDIKVLMSANIPHVSQMAKLYLRNKTPGGMVNYKEAESEEGITNWRGEEVNPQIGDMVELYASYDDGTPIRGKIVGPGKRGPKTFAIKFKNMLGKVVVDTFSAVDEFEIIKKATNEAKKAKPDFLDMDKDGNKKEPMKKAVADKKKHPFKK